MTSRATPAPPRAAASSTIALALLGLAHWLLAQPLLAQGLSNEARLRWEQQCQIRKEKFDLILPRAMRDNGIDMWIVMIKEGLQDPLYEDLGRGFTGSKGFYIFSDRGGERIERTVFGIYGPMLEQCGVYDRDPGQHRRDHRLAVFRI